jgi:hypothetical protein
VVQRETDSRWPVAGGSEIQAVRPCGIYKLTGTMVARTSPVHDMGTGRIETAKPTSVRNR